jgi:uncharacterized protein (DUF2164 family)
MLSDVKDGKIEKIRDYLTQGGIDLDVKDEEVEIFAQLISH